MSASALLIPGCGCCGSTPSGSGSGSGGSGDIVTVNMCGRLVDIPGAITITVALDNPCTQGCLDIAPMPFVGTFVCPLFLFFDDVADMYEIRYMSEPRLVDITTSYARCEPPVSPSVTQRRWVSVGAQYIVVCDPACGTPAPPVLQSREGFFWESSNWYIDPPSGTPMEQPDGPGLWWGGSMPDGSWVRRDWGGTYDPELVSCNDVAFSFSATSGYGLAGCDDSTYSIEVAA
jgi:hypothetical protein